MGEVPYPGAVGPVPDASGRGDDGEGPRNRLTARAGELFVAAELNRRGAYAVTIAGNMPITDILTSNIDQKHLGILAPIDLGLEGSVLAPL
jgi:hypothetical protein